MTKRKVIFLALLALLLRISLSSLVWHGDVYNHMDWGEKFFIYGPQNYFAPQTNVWSYLWPNQPPGTIYLFAAIYKLYKFVFSIFWWVNIKIPLFPSGIITYFESNLYPALLKLPSIIADFGISYFIYKIVLDFKLGASKKRKSLASIGALVFLFNPVIWYNSSVWGQYDSVIFFLTIASFYFLLKRKVTLAMIFYAFSIYTKLTLIVFAPIFMIIYIKQKYPFKDYLKSIIIPLILVALLTYPFSRSEPFSWLFRLYKDKVLLEQRQVITSNAFNLWSGLTGIHQIPHDKLLGPLSYKVWGLIFFGISYLAPLYLTIKKKISADLFWILAVVSFSYFSLLTNMHERYLYSFFPILTILLMSNKRLLWFYIAITLINLLNLYNFWWVPQINFVKQALSLNGGYLGSLLGYAVFFLYLCFYWIFFKKIIYSSNRKL